MKIVCSSIDGRKFGSGFAAGAVSSLVSSGVQAIGGTGGYYLDEDYTQLSTFGSRNPDLLNAMTIAAGGLSGGLSSTIAGGSFWTGARQGLITSGLNHVAHGIIKSYNYGQEHTSREKETELINPDGSQTFGAKAGRILGSFIAYDMDKTFVGKALQIISHFTWELPQQIISVLIAQFTNVIGGIESVYRYSNGSLLLNNRFLMSDVGFTMGNLMTVGPNSSMETIEHEFGHYIQSRRFGPLWIPAFGIPSIMNAWITGGASTLQEYESSFYTERNAGKLGRKYW